MEMSRTHSYNIQVKWTGNKGEGTTAYRSYERSHTLSSAGKPDIAGSSDAHFLGDAQRWNPEDLLVGSISACHQLWYLHLCADAGIAVLAYADEAQGTMQEDPDRGGFFTQITLKPRVRIRRGDNAQLAADLHERAHHFCFIANSVNFPVICEPTIESEP